MRVTVTQIEPARYRIASGVKHLDQAAKRPGTFRVKLQHIVIAPNFMPVCFLVYMATRIAVLFVHPLEQSSDFQWYYQRAVEITSGSGYAEGGVLTAFWPVGWPGFLAALFNITGPSVLAAQIANLIFAALVFGFTAMLGTALFRDQMVGRAAVLILTLYPNQIGYVPLLSTEIFYELLLLLSIYLLMQERLLPALLAGLVFGIATLTKTQSLLLPGFILLGVFITAPSRESLFRLTKIMCAVYVTTMLVIIPWTYRNYVVFHALIPVSTNGGWTLLTGNNPEANGDYTPDTVLAQGITHNPAEQVTMDRLARTRAVTWIKENPIKFLLLMPKKLVRLWGPDGEAEWFYQRGFVHYDASVFLFRAVRGLNQVYYFGILLLALPSIWQVLRRRDKAFPWTTMGLGLCTYFSLISLVFSGQSRFHFSLMPFVAVYAAWTLVRVLTDVRASRAPGVPPDGRRQFG
jgi:Dolichyl-phosphate-mannose-protein mannosyltransferase